ncbi:hypothetical protein L208DRAFT_760174 [Tricholoma matsutake]|nr:hypothetical protein L208DRAFT_760174 [Tricholoma matsutake 945]
MRPTLDQLNRVLVLLVMFIRNSTSKLWDLTFGLVFVTLFVPFSVSSKSDAKGVPHIPLKHQDHANLRRQNTLTPLGPIHIPPPSSFQSSSILIPSTTSSLSSTTSTTSYTPTSTPTPTPTPSPSSTAQSSTSTSTVQLVSTNNSFTSPSLNISSTSDTVSTPVLSFQPTVTQIVSVFPVSTPSSIPPQSGTSRSNRTPVIIGSVIGSCVAAIVILGILFRRWKSGQSSQVDQRPQHTYPYPSNAEELSHSHFTIGSGPRSFKLGMGTPLPRSGTDLGTDLGSGGQTGGSSSSGISSPSSPQSPEIHQVLSDRSYYSSSPPPAYDYAMPLRPQRRRSSQGP